MRSRSDATRGQSETLGVVVLLGITVVGVTGIVLVGGSALDELQSETTVEHAKNAFSSLDKTASTVALGESPTGVVDLELSEGQVSVKRTGRLKIATSNGTTILNRTLGAIEYETGEKTIAYQGGGVWVHDGSGSEMVSPPELHYRGGTLTIPAILIRGDTGTSGSDRLVLREGTSISNVGPGHVPNTTVVLSITSDYYESWADFLRERVDGVSVTVHHHNQTIRARFGQRDIDGDFDTGLVAAGDVTIDTPMGVSSEVLSSGSVDHDGPGPGSSLSCGGGRSGDECVLDGPIYAEELDTRIQNLVTSAATSVPDADIDGGPATLTHGTYYSDGFELDGGTLTFDLSGGNITLFVDGNIGLANNRIRVVNGTASNGVVKIYTLGDVAIAQGNAGVTVESGDAKRFQIYGTSELHFGMGQTNTYGFTGVVYAPRSGPATGSNDAVAEYGLSSVSCADVDMCVGTGSGTVSGALIGGPVTVQQSSSFQYDSSLQAVSPRLPSEEASVPPPLTFLHVSVNVVKIEGPPVVGTPAPTPGPAPTPTPTAAPTPTTTTTSPPTTTATSPPTTVSPGEEPEIDAFSIADGKCGPGAGNGHCVDWEVEDDDDDLVNVTVRLEDASGDVLATETHQFGPSEDHSGQRWFTQDPQADHVRIVAIDGAGNRIEVVKDLP